MFYTKFALKNIADPVDSSINIKKLKIYPDDITWDQLDEIEFGQDIGLQDVSGNVLWMISYERLMMLMQKSYKETIGYFESLLTSINDAVTGVNLDGRIVTWNQVSEKFYGYQLKDVLDQPITNFFKEEAVILKQTIKEKQTIENKYNQPAPNVHVLINANPVYVNGEVIGGISVERDISDLVRLNEELTTTKAYIYDLENKYEKNKLQDPFSKIKGKSPAIRETVLVAKRVAKTDATVLITGESGVGKELFAEGIHDASYRAGKPFVAINCGAIPHSLFESELFGYEKGTFTGANKEGKKGKIDLAQGGTLFLDEVGELPLDLQVKLLRVLQEKSFYRLGGDKPILIDVRIIAATNKDLEKMVEEGKFREDLYYRLNVISLHIPPLRERQADIPELLTLLLKEFSVKYGTPVPKVSSEVMSIFLQNPWKGNVRQLRNVAERLIILSGDEELIEAKHLSPIFFKGDSNLEKADPIVVNNMETMREELTEVEKIRQALEKTYNNKSAAAKLLGISRATLYNKMDKYGLV